jgi:anaerobic carbon-monoxide dehydrogenase iron sulfur subunit
MKRVYAVERHCISCKLCELACITSHSQSKDFVRAMRHEKPRPLTRIHVQERRPISVALQCRHCSEPLCVFSCLTQALQQQDDGTITYDPKYCIGCWTCILACPYGAIDRDIRDGHKLISKCDLCEGRDLPACVEICPNEALVWGEEDEYEAEYAEATNE